jgi:hypothetical protein
VDSLLLDLPHYERSTLDSADAFQPLAYKNGHPMLRQKKHRELPLQHLPEFLPLKMTIGFHFTKLAGI